GLRRLGAARTQAGPGPATGAAPGVAGRPGLRHRVQEAGKGGGGGGGTGGGGLGGGPAGKLAEGRQGEGNHQNAGRGTQQRDGPQAERAETAQDVWILAKQEDARRGDVLRLIQLQFLLAGPDTEVEGGRRMAAENTSDGCWSDRPCLVASRVAYLP